MTHTQHAQKQSKRSFHRFLSAIAASKLRHQNILQSRVNRTIGAFGGCTKTTRFLRRMSELKVMVEKAEAAKAKVSGGNAEPIGEAVVNETATTA